MQEKGLKSYQEVLFIIDEIDPYIILGVPDDAEIETITKSYRELAKKYHPDLFANLTDKDEVKEIAYIFTKITGSFNKLKDPEARKKYDFEKKFRQTKLEAEAKAGISFNFSSATSGNVSFSDNKQNIDVDVKQRKSGEAETLFKLGISFFNANNLEEAIHNFQAAIKIDAKVAKYHTYLALAMKKKGWDGYAQAEFKVALHYDPADKIALENYSPSDPAKQKDDIKQNDKKSGFFDNIASKFFKKK